MTDIREANRATVADEMNEDLLFRSWVAVDGCNDGFDEIVAGLVARVDEEFSERLNCYDASAGIESMVMAIEGFEITRFRAYSHPLEEDDGRWIISVRARRCIWRGVKRHQRV